MIGTVMLIVASLALSACAPKAENGAAQDAAQAARPVPETIQENLAVPAAFADGGAAVRALERLGLTVFPEPQPIPAIRLTSLDGKQLAVADLEGKYVFLNFWATWCPPCREEMPSIQRMSDELSGADFAVYAISVGETKATVQAFLKKTPYTFPIVLDPDGQISAMFAGRGIPTTFILDRSGRAIAGVVGARPWDTAEVFATFKALMDLEAK